MNTETETTITPGTGPGEPTRTSHVPLWLRTRLAKACHKYKLTHPHWDATDGNFLVTTHAHKLCDGPDGIFDHWGSITRDGEVLFVNEPYADDSTIAQMRQFATTLGLEWWIEAGWWLPGWTGTTRFIFRPRTIEKLEAKP
jgi:hypothetical protein